MQESMALRSSSLSAYSAPCPRITLPRHAFLKMGPWANETWEAKSEHGP